MKVQCYAVFDQCSGIYEKPFFSKTDELVKREFTDILSEKEHPFAKHPEHYSLWRLGIFDNTNGKITNEDNECLCTGLEAKSQIKNFDDQTELPFRQPEKIADPRDTIQSQGTG